MPTSPVANPDCQPHSRNDGSGPHTGHRYAPSFSPPAGSCHCIPGGTPLPALGSASPSVRGHGHGISTEPTSPTTVPTAISDQGNAMSSRSHTDATSRNENSTACHAQTANHCHGKKPCST